MNKMNPKSLSGSIFCRAGENISNKLEKIYYHITINNTNKIVQDQAIANNNKLGSYVFLNKISIKKYVKRKYLVGSTNNVLIFLQLKSDEG